MMSNTCVIGSGGDTSETSQNASWADRVLPISLPNPSDKGVDEDAYGNVLGGIIGVPCSSGSAVDDQYVVGSGDQLTSDRCPTLALVSVGCQSGDPQLAELVETASYLDARAPSSSHASIMQSDDENVTVGQKHSCKVAIRDIEAGLYIDNMSYMDEEEKHEVGICKDENNPEHVEAMHEDKEVLLNGEKKSGVGFLEKEGEVHGLRKRRGTKAETIKASVTGDSELGTMPEEDRRGSAVVTRMKDAPVEGGPETKQKPSDKKAGKQSKGAVKPAGRRVSESQPLEDLRAKEDAETNRKVHESLDSFIRQTIREPYMTFPGRPGDKPIQRLRPDLLENHLGGKFGRGFKVEGGSDARDIGTDDNLGTDGHSSDIDGLKDTPVSASKGIGSLGRGSQHSLKVPPGVVFTQAAAKGTDLPGWPLLTPSKMTMTKCDKCSREFCSSLNYRRHVRVHRKSLTEKKDLSKERLKVAEFWDKLTPDQASDIVNYENLEIEDLSGNLLLKALGGFIQQPGMPSIPQGLMKAGSALLDIVQNRPSVYPLPSERLLSILDDASEKTFLSGGTSVAYQRFVFNGDAGKVGLEERNLVASMGFHVELRLVKAWMADKEAEALRNQQALFKEEEAAQQKRAKLLEKRRMKKIRQKERKVTASQLVQELENEFLDDEGNLRGVEEDDSPTATGSSASSLVSAHDLALPGTSDVDMNEELGHLEGRGDQMPGLTGEQLLDRSKAKGEYSMQLSQDIFPPAGPGKSTLHSPEDFSESLMPVSRKGDFHSIDLTGEDKSSNWSSRNFDEAAQDNDRDARTAQSLLYSRSGRSADMHISLHNRKGDQDKGAEFFRRDSDRPVLERKSLRIGRDRSRNEYSEPFQKPGRDIRSYDTRYVDGASQPIFKPVKKANSFAVKSDLGTSDPGGLSRSQQYRSKPSGLYRALPSTGNGQVVWTRKVPQPAVVESCKDSKDIIQGDRSQGEPLNADGWDVKAEFSDTPELATDPTGVLDAGISVREEGETKDVAVTPTLAEVKLVNDNKVVESAVETTEETMVENHEQMLFSGALLVGSLSVPIGKFAGDGFVQSRNYPMFSFASEQSHVSNPIQPLDQEGRDLVSGSQTKIEAVDTVSNERLSHDIPGSFYGLTGNASDCTVSVATPSSSHEPSAKLKPQSPVSGPDRAETGRYVPIQCGHDRLAAKSVSWPTSAGRYVTAKVWRAVGLVGDRQGDALPGLPVAGGDGEGNSTQDEVGVLARSEAADGLLVKKDGERQNCDGSASVDLFPNSVEYSTDQVSYTGGVISARSADSETDVHLSGATVYSGGPVNEDSADTAALLSGLCSLSVFLEVAERFLSERWKVAIAEASPDEFVDCSAEGAPNVAEGCKFTEILPQQLSGQGIRHHSGAGSLPCSSSVVPQSLGKTAHDGAVFLSRIFNDSDQTGMEGVTHQAAHDDQRFDGAGPQDFGMPQALSSEEDAGRRDSLSSPVDEHFTSGNENFRSDVASAAPAGRVHGWERHPESRGGGGGSLGYSHARHSSSRQERWYRNPRDRFPEQRYLPRRRAPVEKNC